MFVMYMKIRGMMIVMMKVFLYVSSVDILLYFENLLLEIINVLMILVLIINVVKLNVYILYCVIIFLVWFLGNVDCDFVLKMWYMWNE